MITKLEPVIRPAVSHSRILSSVVAIAVTAGCLLGLAAAPNAFGATITYLGLDTNTKSDWRTTSVVKPLDPDGDNAYGTAGYLTPNQSSNPSFASLAFLMTDQDPALPNYMTVDNVTDPIGNLVKLPLRSLGSLLLIPNSEVAAGLRACRGGRASLPHGKKRPPGLRLMEFSSAVEVREVFPPGWKPRLYGRPGGPPLHRWSANPLSEFGLIAAIPRRVFQERLNWVVIALRIAESRASRRPHVTWQSNHTHENAHASPPG